MPIYVEYSKGKHVKYVINTDRKIVSATLKVDIDEPQKIFDKIFFKASEPMKGVLLRTSDFYDDRYSTKSTFVGIAKCHPDDKFDVEFGKKLALIRAKCKHYMVVYSLLFKFHDYIDDISNRLNDKIYDIYDIYRHDGEIEYQMLREKGMEKN